jgi:pantetheine-phosphate adenylyltransferase
MPETFTALGGTFDHFHLGHQQFLTAAAQLGQPLIIGVTSDALIQHKKHATSLEPYLDRLASVTKFCAEHGITAQCVQLTDIYGPTLTQKNITHLVCTADTRRGADRINTQRTFLGLPVLSIHEVPFAFDENGEKISSERIRAGEISRMGIVYTSFLSQTHVVSAEAREKLGSPIGKLITDPPTGTSKKYLVGDSTTERFIQEKWPYELAVVDYLKKRVPTFPRSIDRSLCSRVVCNPAHTLSIELVQGLREALQLGEKQVLVIGEEDLAAVILALLLPLKTVLYYGQPDSGLVECEITENIKHTLYTLLCH